MDEQEKSMPAVKPELPDRSKCSDQKSRELEGKAPGDRGMCEKESTTQGSE